MKRVRLYLGMLFCNLGIAIITFGEWFGSNPDTQLRVGPAPEIEEDDEW